MKPVSNISVVAGLVFSIQLLSCWAGCDLKMNYLPVLLFLFEFSATTVEREKVWFYPNILQMSFESDSSLVKTLGMTADMRNSVQAF